MITGLGGAAGVRFALDSKPLLEHSTGRPRKAASERMATPISIRIPHQLGRAEARRRIQGGFANIVRQLPGGGTTCVERWDGDRLTFRVSGLGQTVTGTVDVLDAAVTFELELPGILGMVASGLKGRLQKAGQLLLTSRNPDKTT
ncbi:MAG: polyhydroxyalkanoic acid system family protein [Vitreoscilla sp.]